MTITLLEKAFETLEGTARFVVASFLQHRVTDDGLSAIDTNFSVHAYTNTFPSTLPEYFYMTDISQIYFYATGYNEVCLLKKLKINYPAMLFTKPSLTLEDILQGSEKNAK